jgi:hypothetical protein
MLLNGCADEQTQRQHWRDCSAAFHDECWEEATDAVACEYEYYKACVNVKPTS